MSTTPAFSPGPQITRGPELGRVLSQIFEDLYEQCSLHMAAKMPSSARLGVRPRIAQTRANSSAERPISAASSGGADAVGRCEKAWDVANSGATAEFARSADRYCVGI